MQDDWDFLSRAVKRCLWSKDVSGGRANDSSHRAIHAAADTATRLGLGGVHRRNLSMQRGPGSHFEWVALQGQWDQSEDT